jgi:uncharacterized protein
MSTNTNRLIDESSPYLLQHAHNPVSWFPWGDEALNKAREEDKPILVSIGYAACHWCHVMERESFEDEDTAAIMNEHFINIKIDREERPDLDHIYMDAVQSMTGSGGWPLNVFLTPDLKPFYGGTYFPPQRAFNRASWKEVLLGVAKAFKDQREQIDAQAENLTSHIIESNGFGFSRTGSDKLFDKIFGRDHVDEMLGNVMKTADVVDGGFGAAPKFPQTFAIRFLLHHHHYTNNGEALNQACLSLDKMALGGIYDQIGGGFARYSTDKEWLAPHFEKMLYDNALLVLTYTEAYQLTGNGLYKDIVDETMAFIEREMVSDEGGFFSAIDADSEGVEGKFYTWSLAEVKSILGEDSLLFCEYYDITDHGNWERVNILRALKPLSEFARLKGMDEEVLKEKLEIGKRKLLTARNRRIRPQLDDKILLGWNALMNLACSKAYAGTGEQRYLDMAIRNIDFLERKLGNAGRDDFFHTYKNGKAKIPAFLDDYAFLVQALIGLQEATGNTTYLEKARILTEEVLELFDDTETDIFYFTRFDQGDVVVRKKEIYDGAVPSGNSTMAWNLYYLGVVFDRAQWKERAFRVFASLEEIVRKYPTSFGQWATFIQGITFGIPEIALIGQQITEKHKDLLNRFIPLRIYQSSYHENSDFPLLAGKSISGPAQIYLCKNYTCQNPVNEVDALMALLEHV